MSDVKTITVVDGATRDEARATVASAIMNMEDVAIVGDLWHALACEALAQRLGVGDDWYYPLLGAAELLRRAYVNDPARRRRAAFQEGVMTEQSFTIRQQADAVGQAIEDADEHLTAEECVDRLPALRAAYETLRRMAAAEGDVSELPEELRPGRKVI